MEVGIYVPASVSLSDDAAVWFFFRYRDPNPDGSANTASHKWDYISGPPIYNTDESDTSYSPGGANTWTAAGGTPGPDLHAPLDGRYQLSFGSQINAATDTHLAEVGVSVGSGNDPLDSQTVVAGTTQWTTVMRAMRLTTTEGTRLRMEYRDAASSGTTHFNNRFLLLSLISVSQ
jgi:hypothetical protein